MDPSQVSQIVISVYIYIRKLDCQGREKVDRCEREEVAEENGLSLGSSFLETGKRVSLGLCFSLAHEVLYTLLVQKVKCLGSDKNSKMSLTIWTLVVVRY